MTPPPISEATLAALARRWHGGQSAEGWHFHPDGYSVDYFPRSDRKIIATFDSRANTYKPSAQRAGWAHKFLLKARLSAIHIKPDQSCWYRKPQITAFLTDMAETGLLASYRDIMTYGGSMGGFGALSFAKTLGANRVFAMNPQANLGPAVRDWETRYTEALKQDWTGPLCDLSRQVEDVETLSLCYDPYMKIDRKQIELIDAPHAIHLRMPFVGHRLPSHLNDLKMLGPLFRQTLTGTVDTAAFFQAARGRRTLLRYKKVMLATAKANGTKRRRARLEALLPADDQLIGDVAITAREKARATART